MHLVHGYISMAQRWSVQIMTGIMGTGASGARVISESDFWVSV